MIVMSMTMTRISGADYEELRRRQARILQSDIKISPPPASRRGRNAEPLTRAQIEQLRQAILGMFR